MTHAVAKTYVTTPAIFDVRRAVRPHYLTGVPAPWHKYQVSGPAAEAGINAALLAAEGFIAQTDVFDEGTEFWRSFGATGCNWDLMYGDLGRRWFIAETSIKPYPFCRFFHTGLDQFGKILSEEHLSAGDIERVIVRTG